MPIEPLERRSLLASALASGLLTVTGTAAADTIVLSISGKSIQVSDDGVLTKFTASAVTNIIINAGGGDDIVKIANTIKVPAAINGTKGNDSLTGGGGKDFISGGSGNDSLAGGDGNDILNGDTENDTLRGDAGADAMFGGLGNDTADYVSRIAPLNITINDIADDGEAGEKDNVGIGIESIIGGAGNDMIVGSSINNSLNGKGGNDTLMGGSGVDALIGEVGNDSLVGGPGGDFCDGGKGTDNIQGQSGNDTINAGTGNDKIDGGIDVDKLDYSARVNPLTVAYTSGTGVPAKIAAGETGETDSAAAIESVVMGSGNDTFTADQESSAANVSGGIFTIDGGGGDDAITIDSFNLAVKFNAHGGVGNDVLTYVPHSSAGADAETLAGDAGDDLLKEGQGVPIENLSLLFSGGAGTDTADMLELRFCSMSLDDVANDGYGHDNIQSDVENLFGSKFGGSTIIGNDADNFISVRANALGTSNTVFGMGGDDIIIGSEMAADSLDGGEGDDVFVNADGLPDTINGGAGFDLAQSDPNDLLLSVSLSYAQDIGKPRPIRRAPPGQALSLGAVALAATSASATIDANHILQISGALDGTGAPVADSISILQQTGVLAVNLNGIAKAYNITKLGIRGIFIDSGGGNDNIALRKSNGASAVSLSATITSGSGDDQINCGSGNDSIAAGAGNDSVDGAIGNDTIGGGAGNDVLMGGAGNDNLSGDADNDKLNGGDNLLTTDDGADNIAGGAGFGDFVLYAFRTDNLHIDISDGTNADDGAAGEFDAVNTDVEDIIAGKGDDVIIGNAAANFISGGAGNDSIRAGAGNDQLIGDTGQDTVKGETGTVDCFELFDSTRDQFDLGTTGLRPYQADVGLDVNLSTGHVV